MNRRCLVLLSTLIAGPALAGPLTVEPRVLTTYLDGELTVDPAGVVESYHVTGDVPEGLATKAQEMVRQLRFEPVLVDGNPARAHTQMRVTLAGTPTDDDGLSVHLDNISFPKQREGRSADHYEPVQMKVDQKSMADYPKPAAVAGVDADVLVAVKVARDGSIADASVRQSALLAAGGSDAVVSSLLSQFEYQSLRAVRRWHVKVDVRDGAQPTVSDMTALVVFAYRMKERATPHAGEWTWETRSEKRDTPWLPHDPSEPFAGVADTFGDGLLSDEGAKFRLMPPVGGKGAP